MEDLSILMVDDEPALLNLLSVRLGIFGSRIFTALNGAEALKILANHEIDIVITDIQMPVMNGLELLDHIRAKNVRKPSMLFATAYADNSEVEDYYNRGIDGVFSKPVDSKSLLAAARQITMNKEEIWGALPSLKPDFHLNRKFDSMEKEQANHHFNIGRGGFFLAATEDMPDLNSLISFNIEFSQGPMKKIEGTGHIRWHRTSASKDYPSGVGIDIIYLTNSCRSDVIHYVDGLKTRAFIPRN